MPEKVTGAFTPKQNMLYKLLFGVDIPGYLPPTAEERLRAGVASKTDSIATGLLPRAAGPSEYESLLQRLPEGARARVDSMKAGLLPRASKGGTLSLYDRWIQSLAPEEREKIFKTRAGLLPRAGKEKETKRESILDAIKRVSEDVSKTKKLETGRITPYSDQELFGRVLATEPAKQDSLLDFFTSKTKPIFPEGSIGRTLLEKRGKVKTDTLNMIGRAIERGFAEELDVNELLSGLSIYKKADAEFKKLKMMGKSNREAENAIKSKYGMDLGDLEDFYYVETGKTGR